MVFVHIAKCVIMRTMIVTLLIFCNKDDLCNGKTQDDGHDIYDEDRDDNDNDAVNIEYNNNDDDEDATDAKTTISCLYRLHDAASGCDILQTI